MTNLVEAAVADIREATVNYMVGRAKLAVDRVLAQLEEDDWNLEVSYPYPNSRKDGRNEYKEKLNKRNFAQSLTVRDAERMKPFIGRMSDPHYRMFSQEAIDHHMKIVRDMANASFDQYVAKMTGKIGEGVISVTLDDQFRNLWDYSFLHVVREDGTKEKWKTQIITKCSSLGTVFNQWPSRKVK